MFPEVSSGGFYYRGVASYNVDSLNMAKTYFRIAWYFNSSDPRIQAYLCKILRREGDVSNALLYCKNATALDLKSQDPELYSDNLYNLARVYDAVGEYGKAESFYNAHIEDGAIAEYPQTLYRLARLNFYFFNQPQDALAILEELVSSGSFQDKWANVDKDGIFNLLGRTYLFFERYQEAETEFRRVINLNTVPLDSISNIYRHLNLALSLVEGGKTEEGLRVVEEARRLSPLFSEHCYVAQIYYLAGEVDKAIEAGILKQEDPWCAQVLGFAYSKIGKKQEAKEQLSRFIEWVDNFDERYSESRLEIGEDLPAKSIIFRRGEERTRELFAEIE